MTPRSTNPVVQPVAPTKHLSDHLRVLHKRRWLASAAFLAVFVFGAIRTVKQTPMYEARAEIMIEKEARRATSINTVLDDQQSYYDDDFYPTQLRILESRKLAQRVVEKLGPAKAPGAEPPSPPSAGGISASVRSWGVVEWASSLVGAPKRIDPPAADETTAEQSLISGFLGGLTVTPIRATRMFDITYHAPDPVYAARAANALANEYIAEAKDIRSEATQEATDYLSKELDAQRIKLNDSEAKLAEYKETHDAVGLDDKVNTVSTKLADISGSLTRAQLERINKGAAYEGLKAIQDDRAKLAAHPLILGNPDIQRLKINLNALQEKRTEILAGHGAKYLAVDPIQSQVDDAQAKLDQAEDQVVEAAKTEFDQAKAKETSYQEQYNRQNQETLNLDRKGVEYGTLQREEASNKTLFDTLLARTKETGVSGQFKGSNITIVDAAEVPRVPSSPNVGRDLTLACAEGLVLALGLVFGFEYLDSRIKTPDELKQALNLPFLGIVPAVSVKPVGDEGLLLTGDLPPGFGEAMRAVRTAVIFSSADEGARTIVVTSTAPGEGKTLISTNLGVALAQADQRTLVIDGDLRRPRVHAVFRRPQEPGLSNVLVGTARMSDAVRMTVVPNLYVLASGHIPPNPAELLGSSKYLETIDELRQQFDWIIIDAPPVMAVTDAAILSNSATGVVFVVGAEMTSKRNAGAAVEHLQAARAKFIGAVLNRVDLKRHAYYYSPYYRKDYTRAYEPTER
jgi:succinoglycan biosynthesis transport protein ExoP